MFGCMLRIKGNSRAISEFQRVFKKRATGQGIFVGSGIGLPAQISSTTKFLARHKKQLHGLRKCCDLLTLDFGISKRDVAAQYDYFPPELLKRAGELGMGIELSQYSVSASGRRPIGIGGS